MALQQHTEEAGRPRLLGRISHRQVLLPTRGRKTPRASRNFGNDRPEGVSCQERLVSRHSAPLEHRPPKLESLLRGEYFAALVETFFLTLGFQIALPLTAILTFAGVVGSGASALAAALVDAAAMHHLRRGLIRFPLLLGERGIGCEHGSDSGRDQCPLYRFSVQHRSSFECCLLS